MKLARKGAGKTFQDIRV